jgi:transposase
MRPAGKASKLEERRREAVRLVEKEGWSQTAVAKKFKVTTRAVQHWMQWHRGRGKRSMGARATPGRPPRMETRQKQKLRRLIIAGAKAAGFSSDLWTCRRVRDLVRREFAIEYHEDHIGRLLRVLGFSPQKPERRALERNERAIRTWVHVQWPRIKKKPKSKRRSSRSSTKPAS